MSSIEKPEAERPGAGRHEPAGDPAAPAAVQSGAPDRVLKGRYELVDEVARGGVGTVWRATDLVLDRRVAVKELRLPDDVSSAERESLLQRTTREARVAARLAHPGVVTVLDVVDEDDRPWIVMEYIDARTLAGIVDVAGPLPYQRVAEIGLQLIDALKAAHEDGIVHRDVKPENVMISEDGRVVLTDFGLAAWTGESALTSSGRIIGSPSYIPPERAKAGPVGPESDLWSLGATLYAAVEGHPPYDRKGYIRILKGADLEDPPAAQNAGPLAPVLAGLLHVQPGDRLTAENATKMLRIAALAPWAPETSPDTAAKTATTGTQPVVPAPSREGGYSADDDPGDAGDPGAASAEPDGRAEESGAESGGEAAGDGGSESARDQFLQGAHLLRSSVQGSVSDLQDHFSDSVSIWHDRIQRHRPESVGDLLTSIRDSTDTLGLTSSGKHGEGSPLLVVLGVVAGVLVLLGVVLWALLFRT
ncbi:serine/threonine-protein kinase [Streptomonospora salina]|uniref:non-specific serine/threonine protein kinase n=1 Tax=Streptomonospora salina TaxID=104205 RepID=A0A841E9D1_9ACTN|nr:serine/threonine-protein kinase [Streptomonospora salina]MBB5997693.1 serine/threonine protein kinase [Streptomonospora salina]